MGRSFRCPLSSYLAADGEHLTPDDLLRFLKVRHQDRIKIQQPLQVVVPHRWSPVSMCAPCVQARKGSVAAATTMIEGSMVWRRTYGVNNILSSPFPDHTITQIINPHM